MKKGTLTTIISVAILALIIMSFSMFVSPSKAYADGTSYVIGDTGPAGGIIFYVDGSSYLEAAPSNQGLEDFSNIYNTLIGTTGTAIGTGQANTNAIIGQLGHTASAAQMCALYTFGGYDDWFLPSKDELELMYTNLHLSGLGGFGASRFWSSSEFSDTKAWAIMFSNGVINNHDKFIGYNVRAIRAFTVTEEAWVRTMPMTVWQVWINENNDFQFIFWYPYKDKNWVRIYDMEDNMVFEVDLPVNDPNLIVDLPDGFYMVKTYHDQELLQEFLIGKP